MQFYCETELSWNFRFPSTKTTKTWTNFSSLTSFSSKFSWQTNRKLATKANNRARLTILEGVQSVFSFRRVEDCQYVLFDPSSHGSHTARLLHLSLCQNFETLIRLLESLDWGETIEEAKIIKIKKIFCSRQKRTQTGLTPFVLGKWFWRFKVQT